MKLLLAVDVRADAEALVARAVPWVTALGTVTDLAYVAPDAGPADERALNSLLALVPEARRGRARVTAADAVAVTIAEQASEYDLVAVGAARDPEAAPFWLGSVAERVLRTATRTTLVVRDPAPRTPMPRVLFGVDPTNGTEQLLPAVVTWVQRMNALLDLVVVDELSPTRPPEDPHWAILEKQAETYERVHLEMLRDVAERLVPKPHRGQAFVDRGRAAAALVERGKGYDLVAVGTHGRSLLTRALLGSVAERVARTAASSVLVVRT